MDKATEINNTGVKHFLNRQFGEAEKCYKEVLDLNPENVTALNNMGLLYHQKKQYEKAIEYFEKAISIHPNDTYYVNAGNAAACLNRAKEAEAWYFKALEMNENSENARESLARLYEFNNRLSDAAAIWRKLVQTSGKEKFKIEYAKNLVKQKKHGAALDLLYNRAAKENSTVWHLIGMCEYQMKNYGLAEKALKKGLSIDPDDEQIRHYLAVTLFAKRQVQEGMRQFDKILKINPDNYQILTEKGVILLSRDKTEEALELFEKSLRINPEYEKAIKYKKMALEKIKKAEKS